MKRLLGKIGERLGRDLIVDLADARERGGPELREELALIADRLAKSEADRLALNWAAAVTRSRTSSSLK